MTGLIIKTAIALDKDVDNRLFAALELLIEHKVKTFVDSSETSGHITKQIIDSLRLMTLTAALIESENAVQGQESEYRRMLR